MSEWEPFEVLRELTDEEVTCLRLMGRFGRTGGNKHFDNGFLVMEEDVIEGVAPGDIKLPPDWMINHNDPWTYLDGLVTIPLLRRIPAGEKYS